MSAYRLSTMLNEVPDKLRKRAARNMPAAAAFVEAELKQTVSVQGTPDAPSRPGEPPHRVTGRGQASIKATPDPARLSITVTADRHMALQATGTSRQAARPWVKVTFERIRSRVFDILVGR